MLRLFTACIIILTLTPVMRADPLDKRQVPSGAVWVIHLDADAARDSLLGRRLRDLWLSNSQSAMAIEKARQTFGIDPTRDIRSITLYGTDYAPNSGVVIARGKVDRQRIEAFLKALPAYRSETIDGRTLYFWAETAPDRRHDSAGAFFGDDIVVIAPDGRAVVDALIVLEGKAPGLSSDSPLAVELEPGAIVQASAAGLAQAKGLAIQSPILRQCQSGSLVLGEQEGDFYVHGKIVTQSADTATRLCQLIVGAKAMAEFQSAEGVSIGVLLRPLKVVANDKTVEIQWQYSSLELVKIVQTEQVKHSAASQPGSGQ